MSSSTSESSAVKCRQCGYDLAEVGPDGVCSECGCSAAWSRTGFFFANGPKRIPAKLRLWIWLLVWSGIVFFGVSVARGAWYFKNPEFESPALLAAMQSLQVVGMVGFILGVFAVTQGDMYAPREFTSVRDWRVRWTARLSLSFAGAAMFAVIFIPIGWSRNPSDIVYSSLIKAAIVASLPGAWGLGRCLALLSSRAGDDDLGAGIRRTSKQYVVLMSIALLEILMRDPLFSTPISWVMAHLTFYVFAQQTSRFMTMVIGIIPLVCFVLLASLVSRLFTLSGVLRGLGQTLAPDGRDARSTI